MDDEGQEIAVGGNCRQREAGRGFVFTGLKILMLSGKQRGPSFGWLRGIFWGGGAIYGLLAAQ